MEWYRVVIVLVGVAGIVLSLVNWYVNKVDIPNGILTILMLIISSALGPDALVKLRDSFTKTKESVKKEDDPEGEDK